MRPKLLITRKLPDAVERRAVQTYDAVLNAADQQYSPKQMVEKAQDAHGILCTVTDDLSAPVIAQLPNTIRVLATFSVGYDHIDVAAARARGIVVTNTPDVLTNATADITMLLILGAARRASEGEALMRQAVRRELPADLAATFHADADAMLPHCDFLALHVPLLAETRGWLNAERLARLPKGAIVVNSSRGPVVDDAALISALKSGHIAAAGLDVFTGEPRANPGYRGLPNTFLLPHLGSATTETRTAMGNRALDNLDAFYAGKQPPDLVS